MKIAVSSDMYSPIIDQLIDAIKKKGHHPIYFGPKNEGQEEDWTVVTQKAINHVQMNESDEAIVLCWTGTGCTILANKYPGIRAALCFDGETAKGAQIYNHANVLGLSLRLTTPEGLQDILDQ